MATFNSSITSRKFTSFTVDESEEQVDVEGEYTFSINNNGILPTGSLTVKLSSLKVGSTGVEVVSDQKQTIGRVKPLGTKDVTFSFTHSSSNSDLNSVVQSVCNEEIVPTSTECRVVGAVVAIDASSSGSYAVDKTNCNLYSTPTPEPDPEPQPEPTPDPEPEPPEDGSGSEDDEPEQPEDDSEIIGDNLVSMGETNRYEWADFPSATERLDYVLLSEQEISEEDASLVLAGDGAESLLLDLTLNVSGDFLIVTSAIADGEVIEQQEKVVTAGEVN